MRHLFLLREFFNVYAYILMAKVHWPPREKIIIKMFDLIAATSNLKTFRILDIGCGPGQLVETITGRNLTYLGIDNNPDMINYCLDRYAGNPGIDFSTDDFTREAFQIGKNDIVVVNGVAHHLNDTLMEILLKKALSCHLLIIVDHLREQPHLSVRNCVPFILQSLDRGKFVRMYSYFTSLKNYTLVHSEEFPVRMAGFPCWTHFCNVYKPDKST